MKKFIYLAFAVLALLVSSCSKDDNEGSTSLDGDWYLYVGNNNSSNKGYRWFPPQPMFPKICMAHIWKPNTLRFV